MNSEGRIDRHTEIEYLPDESADIAMQMESIHLHPETNEETETKTIRNMYMASFICTAVGTAKSDEHTKYHISMPKLTQPIPIMKIAPNHLTAAVSRS